MLSELKVSQFAIIENIHIEFSPGLNIISGETGAGKSILLRSLGLLMGDKAGGDWVRTGSEQATVEGAFDLGARPDLLQRLDELGLSTGEPKMVVRRIVSAANKNRIYINGGLSTLADLRDLVSPLVELAGAHVPLIEMTGQHDNRHLLSRSYHLDMIDQAAGHWRSRLDFARLFAELQDTRKQIEELTQQERESAQRLDFLKYQQEEIRSLELRPQEDGDLESETKRIKNSAKLVEFVRLAEELLFESDDSVSSRLHVLLHRASELKAADPNLVERLELLAQARTLVTETGYALREYQRELDVDPGRLQALEERLSRLRSLQKKYGSTVSDILAALAQIENEVHRLENSDVILKDLISSERRIEQDLRQRADELHTQREKAARDFAKKVNEELRDLNMKGLTFSVSVQRLNELCATGSTTVEFMTQVSKSEPAKPLAKTASGGELSRILLAMKQVGGAQGFPRTYLFDEVDTGVSGETAQKVGRKLKRIAKGQQVICVTHLPQVASFGDSHFTISKEKKGSGGVQMQVRSLEAADQRVKEVARLLSGDKITSSSLKHAEQLMADAT